MTDYNAEVLMCAMDFFDGLVISVPSPDPSTKLPGNLVLPDAFHFKSKGLGSKTDDPGGVVQRGTVTVTASFLLWDSEAGVLSFKARNLIAHLLGSAMGTPSRTAGDGAAVCLTVCRMTFSGTAGPDYQDSLKAWKIAVSGMFEIDYEVRAPQAEGVIERISVNLSGATAEYFEVS